MSSCIGLRQAVSYLGPIFLSLALLTGCAEEAPEKPATLEKQATLVYRMSDAEHPEASLDLDQGSVLDSPEADITLIMSGGSDLFVVLLPINDAKAKPMGIENIGLSDCKQQIEDYSKGNIPEISAGNHICVLTGQGRLALVQIEAASSPEAGVARLQVSYIVETAPLSK